MNLDSLSLELKVKLGNMQLSKEAYQQLEVGDILVLDAATQDQVTIWIEEEKKFLGSIGLFETKKAVTIDEQIHT